MLVAGSGPSRGTWWWWTTCECVDCGPLCFTKHSCTEQCESGFGGWQCSPPVSSSPALVKRQCQHQGLALRLKAGPGAYVALCRGRADGEVFESTKARGKPIVYLYGSRPFTGGICAGRGRGALLVLPQVEGVGRGLGGLWVWQEVAVGCSNQGVAKWVCRGCGAKRQLAAAVSGHRHHPHTTCPGPRPFTTLPNPHTSAYSPYLVPQCYPRVTGVEEAMATMKAGGRRRIIVPPSAGFGDAGAVLRPTEHVPEKQGVIPGGAELEYEIELKTVSIPPS